MDVKKISSLIYDFTRFRPLSTRKSINWPICIEPQHVTICWIGKQHSYNFHGLFLHSLKIRPKWRLRKFRHRFRDFTRFRLLSTRKSINWPICIEHQHVTIRWIVKQHSYDFHGLFLHSLKIRQKWRLRKFPYQFRDFTRFRPSNHETLAS